MSTMVRTALVSAGAVLLADAVVAGAADLVHEYWRIWWSPTIILCLGVVLGRSVPLAEALVAVVAAAVVSATAGSALIDALQPWWVPRHASPLSGIAPWIALALTIVGGWAVAAGGAFQPSSVIVRFPLAAYALAGAIDWVSFALLNGWVIGYVWPAVARIVTYGVMAFALGRAGTGSRDASRACTLTIAAGELTTNVLLVVLYGGRYFRLGAWPETVLISVIAAGAIAAAAYALGRERSVMRKEAVR
ncbi:MAG TPA: hypothetical protein VK669_00345 [Candidatus Limnocylindrales bacterium]|nr:hypothetical protein [Candidatus Limnocylindrales bacterium]